MKRAMMAGAVVLAIGVSAVWIATGASSKPVPHSDPPMTVSTTTTIKHGVTARIELEHDSLVQGSAESGMLIVDNNSGKPFDLGFCGIGAQLVNGQVVYASLPMPACDRLAPVGESRTKFTVHANQPMCEVDSNPAHSGPLLPPCEPDFLPAGTYHIAFPTNLAVPTTSVTVTPFVK
jgi:hypothetical protein